LNDEALKDEKQNARVALTQALVILNSSLCGAGGIRTHVQTYSPKAFYMLILELIVGKWQEPDKPTISVAEWS